MVGGLGMAEPFPSWRSVPVSELCWQNSSLLPLRQPTFPEEPTVILKHRSDYVLWLPCLRTKTQHLTMVGKPA